MSEATLLQYTTYSLDSFHLLPYCYCLPSSVFRAASDCTMDELQLKDAPQSLVALLSLVDLTTRPTGRLKQGLQHQGQGRMAAYS